MVQLYLNGPTEESVVILYMISTPTKTQEDGSIAPHLLPIHIAAIYVYRPTRPWFSPQPFQLSNRETFAHWMWAIVIFAF